MISAWPERLAKSSCFFCCCMKQTCIEVFFCVMFAGRGGQSCRSGESGKHPRVRGPSQPPSRNPGEAQHKWGVSGGRKTPKSSSHQRPLQRQNSRHRAVKQPPGDCRLTISSNRLPPPHTHTLIPKNVFIRNQILPNHRDHNKVNTRDSVIPAVLTPPAAVARQQTSGKSGLMIGGHGRRWWWRRLSPWTVDDNQAGDQREDRRFWLFFNH